MVAGEGAGAPSGVGVGAIMAVGVGETDMGVLVGTGIKVVLVTLVGIAVAVAVAIRVEVVGSAVVMKVAIGLSGDIVPVALVDSLACPPGASVASHALTKAEISRLTNPMTIYRLKIASFSSIYLT